MPGASAELADQVARIVRSIRALELKKAPSVSETLDWARTLVVLGVETIDADLARNTLNVLLKYKTDLDRVAKEPDLTSAKASNPYGSVVLDVLTGFVTELRAAGLPVSLTESIDAADAIGHIPLEDREALKYALAATLVKSSTHWAGLRDGFRGVLLHAGGQVRHRGRPVRGRW